tara:strand:+ start:326 stop:598 length:273 start_codon:yes stop_codon:yes gene_type:complete
MNKISYTEYSAIVNVVFSEELMRLEEWLYSIKNNYDCSADRYWVCESPQDVPSLAELSLILDGIDQSLLFSQDQDIVENTIELITEKWNK